MKFVHYTNTPIGKFRKPKDMKVTHKPIGVLWVAKGEAWKEFVEDNFDDGWKEYEKHKYVVDIDVKDVITLRTYKDIKEFDSIYGSNNHFAIDWNKVRQDNPTKCGIYIKNPSLFRARQDFAWYSSFDVESIGLWNDSCIKSMKMDS